MFILVLLVSAVFLFMKSPLLTAHSLPNITQYNNLSQALYNTDVSTEPTQSQNSDSKTSNGPMHQILMEIGNTTVVQTIAQRSTVLPGLQTTLPVSESTAPTSQKTEADSQTSQTVSQASHTLITTQSFHLITSHHSTTVDIQETFTPVETSQSPNFSTSHHSTVEGIPETSSPTKKSHSPHFGTSHSSVTKSQPTPSIEITADSSSKSETYSTPTQPMSFSSARKQTQPAHPVETNSDPTATTSTSVSTASLDSKWSGQFLIIIVIVLCVITCFGGVIIAAVCVSGRRKKRSENFGFGLTNGGSHASRKKKGGEMDAWAGPVALNGEKDWEGAGEEAPKTEQGSNGGEEEEVVLSTFTAIEKEENNDKRAGDSLGATEAQRRAEEQPLLTSGQSAGGDLHDLPPPVCSSLPAPPSAEDRCTEENEDKTFCLTTAV